MDIKETGFPGLLLIKPKVHADARGFFLESYSDKSFLEKNLVVKFIQDNHAHSVKKGVLRGLHFQTPPFAQAKLVRVVRGAVLDVVLDLRTNSPTFGKHAAFTLSEENFLQLFVPHGFAHGYLTLTDTVDFLYKVDNLYSPEHDGGILWNDPDLKIDWQVEEAVLSDKDRLLPCLKDFDSPFRL